MMDEKLPLEEIIKNLREVFDEWEIPLKTITLGVERDRIIIRLTEEYTDG